MSRPDASDEGSVLRRLREQARTGQVRVTLHAHQEMIEEEIALDDVLQAIANSEILENYPEHRRGACCLLSGGTMVGRPLHVVCTTALQVLILITVYEPKPPKWVSPTHRRR